MSDAQQFDSSGMNRNYVQNYHNVIINFDENSNISLKAKHSNGSSSTLVCRHTYNKSQIKWFKAGSALNLISSLG